MNGCDAFVYRTDVRPSEARAKRSGSPANSWTRAPAAVIGETSGGSARGSLASTGRLDVAIPGHRSVIATCGLSAGDQGERFARLLALDLDEQHPRVDGCGNEGEQYRREHPIEPSRLICGQAQEFRSSGDAFPWVTQMACTTTIPPATAISIPRARLPRPGASANPETTRALTRSPRVPAALPGN